MSFCLSMAWLLFYGQQKLGNEDFENLCGHIFCAYIDNGSDYAPRGIRMPAKKYINTEPKYCMLAVQLIFRKKALPLKKR